MPYILGNQVTITAGQNTSNGVFVGKTTRVVGIDLPNVFTGNKAHIQTSVNNVEWYDIYDQSGALYEIKPTEGIFYIPEAISNVIAPFVRFRSNATESADRLIRFGLTQR
jgi:hypothetical protein